MNGEELDKAMRKILLEATPATSLSSIKALMELGFGPVIAARFVLDVLEAKKKGNYPS